MRKFETMYLYINNIPMFNFSIFFFFFFLKLLSGLY